MSGLMRRLSWNKNELPKSRSVESLSESGVDAAIVDLDGPSQIEGESEDLHPLSLINSKLRVQDVTVFADRAEVKRLVHVKGNVSEDQEKEKEKEKKSTSPSRVIVSGVPLTCSDSSIRVSVNQPSVKILEVSIRKVKSQISEQDKKKIEDLLEEKKTLEMSSTRVQKVSEWIGSYSNSMSGVPMPDHGGIAPSRIKIEEAESFLKFYNEKLEDVDTKKASLSKRIQEIDKEVAKLGKQVEDKEISFIYSFLESPVEFEAVIAYVVSNASWTPVYDIRVKSSMQNRVEITYNASITNSSGDNWDETNLSLSTAQPQIGALPPTLNSLFVRPRPEEREYSPSFAATAQMSNRLEVNSNPLYSSIPMKKKAMEPALVEKGISSSSFKIQRKAKIPSNSKPHKVTIDTFDLESAFSYTILPKHSKNAYLRANCVNNTPYTFLPGKLNVYMDGTFLSTSEIKLTNPMDDLTLFLGVDQSISIEVKENFYKENKGLVSKTNINRYHRIFTIKNTKSDPIQVNVFDQLPRSQDSKIKVTLLKPIIKEDSQEVKLNEFNNMRWQKTIEPSKDYVIDYEYSIEFSSSTHLQFTTAAN